MGKLQSTWVSTSKSAVILHRLQPLLPFIMNPTSTTLHRASSSSVFNREFNFHLLGLNSYGFPCLFSIYIAAVGWATSYFVSQSNQPLYTWKSCFYKKTKQNKTKQNKTKTKTKPVTWILVNEIIVSTGTVVVQKDYCLGSDYEV
jgi:SNF family Na+-dependent transporter